MFTMKNLTLYAVVLSALTISFPALAWEFTQLNIQQRDFEFTNRYGSNVYVGDVRCTHSDGYDALTIHGYRTFDRKWVFVNEHLTGKRVRQANKYAPDTLAAYMNFCARVNRY